MVGFRAPYFKLNGALGAALRDAGFQWDSSISGKDPRRPAAPMHAADLSPCAAAGCANWSGLHMWCGAAAGRGRAPAMHRHAAGHARQMAMLVACLHATMPTLAAITCLPANPTPGCGRREVPAYTLPGSGGQAFRRVDPAPLPDMPVLEVTAGLSWSGQSGR